MTVSSSGNTALDNISSSYLSNDTTTEETEDYLGRETFLTMLVAQLENQDPLNPMEGTDFSSQLAEFSSLEQLMNLNESMESLAQAFSDSSETDLMSYMGKQVTGTLDTMQVSSGEVSGGYFSLTDTADVIVQIADSSGTTVKRINLGTVASGSHLISWDGTDDNGEAVDDGTYTYSVLANTGSGYTQIDNSVTGTADGVAYRNGKGYLVVQGLLIDPDKLSSVQDISEDETDVDSAMIYLGKTVESNEPIIRVDDGVVSGTDLSFNLESAEAVTVKVYDPFNNLVRTIEVDASETSGGENLVHWDAVGDNGYQVDDGLYYYTVTSESGTATTPVKEEVSGIRNTNGVQYLVLADSGRLLSVSSITAVSN
jgi:flagellar basal-body rod modification protein FlgD